MKYKTYQKSDSHTYILGAFPTMEALFHVPHQLERILIHSTFTDTEKMNQLTALHEIPMEVNDAQIEKLSDKENVYVIGVLKKYENPVGKANHLVLVNPSNTGNLGTIMRTMLGFGMIHLVIIRPSVDIFDPKTIRASMGAIFHLHISFYDTYEQYKKEFPNQYAYPLMLQAKTKLHQLMSIETPYSLVFGNEATGLPDSFLKEGNPLIIQHTAYIDSLNLPIAVAITLYEFAHH